MCELMRRNYAHAHTQCVKHLYSVIQLNSCGWRCGFWASRMLPNIGYSLVSVSVFELTRHVRSEITCSSECVGEFAAHHMTRSQKVHASMFCDTYCTLRDGRALARHSLPPSSHPEILAAHGVRSNPHCACVCVCICECGGGSLLSGRF